MADIQDLEVPDFLQNNDEDDIFDEMMEIIPDEYDKSEGQHVYNFSFPSAKIASQLRGYDLIRAIELIWPRFTKDIEFMEYHAETRNLFLKEAQYATGTITFTGTPDVVIPAGYICSTESRNDVPSKDYITLEECVIGADGTVTVNAQASTAGAEGNTAANTILINATGYDDVTGVTNLEPFTGGIAEESIESLLERIQNYDKLQGDSNVGNPGDYQRWAESVPGTGHANVIRSRDTSGLVTIILTDGNGEPASEEICEKVYNYIMSPDDDSARLAPCGANLSVIPPTTMAITVSAVVEITAGTSESITTALVKGLNDYFPEAIDGGEILLQKVRSILGNIDGVYDYSNLTINGAEENISLESGTFPITDASKISITILE